MSLGYVGQSSAQAKQYLLCPDCEQRFNREGERWVVANCSHLKTRSFHLRDSLERAQPILSGPKGAAFDAAKIPTINISALAYFSASVIWRASVRPWQLQKEIRQSIKMARTYQEELRRYLLGGPAPQTAIFSVFVVSTTPPMPLVVFPESLDEDSARVTYRFYIPGIWFFLLLGEHITADDRNMCILRSASHPICLSACADALPSQISYDLYRNGRQS